MTRINKTKLKKVAQEYGLADVYLFGSKITGFQREESDLDVGVRFREGLPDVGKRGKIYGNLFADLVPCFPSQKIDLVFIEEAPLHFKFRVISEGVLVYNHNLKASFNFKEKIINHYRDYKYFIDEYFKGVLETVGARRAVS